MRSLGLKSSAEWFELIVSQAKKPADIPAKPDRAYANDGWAGMDDWLGTGKVAPGHYRSFKKARDYVRRLGLKSRTEWSDYCKSGKKPADIPANPNSVYAHDGWVGWGDWLGTGRIRGKGWRSFREARAFARSCHFKSIAAWTEFCKSDKKPHDIPAGPSAVYANDGWTGWSDWLGTGR